VAFPALLSCCAAPWPWTDNETGLGHGPIKPWQLYPVHSSCCDPTTSTYHLGFNLCQLCSELLPCGFYQCLHHLYVEECPLALHVQFFVETLSSLMDKCPHCFLILSCPLNLSIRFLVDAMGPLASRRKDAFCPIANCFQKFWPNGIYCSLSLFLACSYCGPHFSLAGLHGGL
jgi:hypothetical protein